MLKKLIILFSIGTLILQAGRDEEGRHSAPPLLTYAQIERFVNTTRTLPSIGEDRIVVPPRSKSAQPRLTTVPEVVETEPAVETISLQKWKKMPLTEQVKWGWKWNQKDPRELQNSNQLYPESVYLSQLYRKDKHEIVRYSIPRDYNRRTYISYSEWLHLSPPLQRQWVRDRVVPAKPSFYGLPLQLIGNGDYLIHIFELSQRTELPR